MTKRFSRSTGLFSALVAAVGLASCASGRMSGDPFRDGPGPDRPVAASEALVVVDHGGRTGSDLTVYVIADGRRTRLGRVAFGEEKEYRVQGVVDRQVVLLAEIVGERDLVSRDFFLAQGSGVRWDIALNQVTFIRSP
jgi:hypothetical protein